MDRPRTLASSRLSASSLLPVTIRRQAHYQLTLLCYNLSMYLFAGLGNPGPEYQNHRHNAGFQAIDYLLTQPVFAGHQLKSDQTFKADYCKVTVQTQDTSQNGTSRTAKETEIIFLKPQTFMNRSGQSLQRIMQFFKIHPTHTFILYDDLDISLGQFKITQKGPKIHNGISSIRDTIGDDFYKIRIGIENRQNSQDGYRIPGETYVLQNFHADEVQKILLVFKLIYERITSDILRIA